MLRYQKRKYTQTEETYMHDERSLLQKTNDFMQAFLEFLGRPKTIFDLKDRGRLLLILLLVVAVIEGLLYYLENLK